MVLIAIGIQDDDRRSPFHAEAIDQGLVLVEINLKGNVTFLDRKTDIGVRVGNSFQLLTPYSEVVIEIHQDQFLFLLRLCLCRCKGRLPLHLCHV